MSENDSHISCLLGQMVEFNCWLAVFYFKSLQFHPFLVNMLRLSRPVFVMTVAHFDMHETGSVGLLKY